MRFEFSVALKYLWPRARQLSTAIISLVSILVISLVVWLVVVFLSVTHGIEKKWIEELVALNAPIRVIPKEAYYKSYYYQIDSASDKSNYSLKTLGEKLHADSLDPYDPSFDAELPPSFPKPDLKTDGSLKDLVKESWEAITAFDLQPQEFEVAFSNLQLDMQNDEGRSVLNQLAYISSFTTLNKRLQKLILPTKDESPLWASSLSIPSSTTYGDGILVSKSFQKHGVALGDRGHLSYLAPGASDLKEQRIAVYVAGFYDPGIMPLGSRVIFADPTLLETLRNQISLPDAMVGNGFNIFLEDLSTTDQVKTNLQKAFKEKGLDTYFEIESFADYEFAKPVLDQLKSDKTLFTLIAIIILIVACSNIISMLILLVNDKKKEIGILQSMGVQTKQIATIFGLCGCIMGFLSSLVGTSAAIFTLHHLQSLINFLSFLQGREAFQSIFYGEGLPNEVSMNALSFVIVATVLISLIAGIVPAVKASRIKPAVILRSE